MHSVNQRPAGENKHLCRCSQQRGQNTGNWSQTHWTGWRNGKAGVTQSLVTAGSPGCLVLQVHKEQRGVPWGCGSFLWTPPDAASPRDTQVCSDRSVSPRQTLPAAPGGGQGMQCLHLSPNSTKGRGRSRAHDPTVRAGRKITSARPRLARRIPVVVPVSTNMPTPLERPHPQGCSLGNP